MSEEISFKLLNLTNQLSSISEKNSIQNQDTKISKDTTKNASIWTNCFSNVFEYDIPLQTKFFILVPFLLCSKEYS